MNRIAAITTFAFVIANFAHCGTAEEIYRKASPAVMTLLVKDKDGDVVGNGTAFMVASSGYAVTAYHVIKDATNATVHFSDGKSYKVEGLVDGDEKRDIALIKVQVTGRPFLQLGRKSPSIGADSFVIGAPKGLEFTITQGIVNQIRDENGVQTIQFSAPVSPGNSGSPLLDANGVAIGVVSFQRTDGQNLNFATPSNYLQDLNWKKTLCQLPLKAAVTTASIPVKNWVPCRILDTGLSMKMPMKPEPDKAELDGELAKVAVDFRSTKVTTECASIAVTYFDFKPDEAPKTIDVAAQVKQERSKTAIKLDDASLENPTMMVFKPEGADSGHAVVASYESTTGPVVEATAVLAKGNRMWVIIISYPAESENGLAQLRALFDSMKIEN